MGANIADWTEHWDHFDVDLYVRILVAKKIQIENE
jgi:hypothetical protein